MDVMFLLEEIVQYYCGTHGHHKVNDIGKVDRYMVFVETAWT